MKAIILAQALALLPPMQVKAQPDHCVGYAAEELEAIMAMPPSDFIQWLTDEISICDMAADQLAINYNNRGAAYYLEGEYQLAVDDYTQAIALKPDLATAFNNRAMAYCALKPPRMSESLLDIRTAGNLNEDLVIRLKASLQRTGYYSGLINEIFDKAAQEAWLQYCGAEIE